MARTGYVFPDRMEGIDDERTRTGAGMFAHGLPRVNSGGISMTVADVPTIPSGRT